MNTSFNYKPLYYYWEVVKQGGISRGTEKLGMAVPAVSAKVRELALSLWCALLKPAVRLAASSLACVSRVCFAMVPATQMSHSMKSGS